MTAMRSINATLRSTKGTCRFCGALLYSQRTSGKLAVRCPTISTKGTYGFCKCAAAWTPSIKHSMCGRGYASCAAGPLCCQQQGISERLSLNHTMLPYWCQ
eukprot:scaffold156324_cov16-Tisochrysis_lutea.AAC.1